MEILDDVRQLAGGIMDEVVSVRRELHAHPEIGFQEERTARRIGEFLTARGIEHRTGVATTGVLATIRGTASGGAERPSRAVLLRADMDCLPLKEENEVPYRSMRDGFMHACGHDGHVAILLGVAHVLDRLKDRLHGTVRLAFQPGEEGFGGAIPLIEQGALSDPDCEAAFALHIWNSLPVRRVGVCPGPAMAAVDEFRIEVVGRGGHGSEPFDTIDPVVVAAHIVTALQTIVSRNINALDAGVVTVGSIHAGTTHNIIPERAELVGTLRSFKPEIRELLRRRVTEIPKAIASAFGATAGVTLDHGYPSTINDVGMAKFALDVAAEVAGAGNAAEARPTMGGEDFSYFLQKVPGAFLFLGSANAGKGLDHPHHSPRFDFDEACLPLGVELMSTLALRYLESPPAR